jgi:general secretion pathway protein I
MGVLGVLPVMIFSSQSQGFTLLEVLVATAIIALALGAIIKTTGAGSANIAYLRDKTFAHWVAMNQIAELQASGAYPKLDRKSGEEEMASRDWYWTMEVKETPDKDVRRVEVSVRQEKQRDAPKLDLVTGFFTRYSAKDKKSGSKQTVPSSSDKSK